MASLQRLFDSQKEWFREPKGLSSAITLLTGACRGICFCFMPNSVSGAKTLTCGTRVFCHLQVIEYLADAEHELPHFLCSAANTFGFDEGSGKTP